MSNAVIDRYDRVAEGYRQCWAPVLHPGGERLLDRIEAAVPGLATGAQAAVLDVGCGTGNQLLPALSRWKGARITGLDASRGMLRLAESAVAGQPEAVRGRVEFTLADAADMPFDDESFDIVMSSFVVQLVPDRPAVLREMHRVLRRGGLLAIAGWVAERDDIAFPPEDVFEDVIGDLGLVRPPRDEQRAGDFASVRSAAAELRRAGFRGVAARPDVLDFHWTAESYATYKERSRELELFESVDPAARQRLADELRGRLARLPQDAFRFQPPIVTIIARRP